MKKCSQCRVLKEDDEFLNERGKFVKKCTRCREYLKVYYNNNRDKMLKCAATYREKHREEILKRHKSWCGKNRDKMSEYDRVYYKKNREEIRNRKKKYNCSSALYVTYAGKLTILEDPIEGENGELLVQCAKCGLRFSPTSQAVRNRITALNSEDGTERRLYCSEKCKRSCEVYRKRIDPAERATRFERDPAWSKDVKERAKYLCERCGSKEKLEAHHEIAVKVDSTKANDLDNGICLCHECHMKAHSESGCTIGDLRRHNAANPQS